MNKVTDFFFLLTKTCNKSDELCQEYKILLSCLLIQAGSFKKENQLMYIWAKRKKKGLKLKTPKIIYFFVLIVIA